MPSSSYTRKTRVPKLFQGTKAKPEFTRERKEKLTTGRLASVNLGFWRVGRGQDSWIIWLLAKGSV